MELPEFNKRIKKIIDIKAGGNVKKFSEMIGISQQKVNRLFNLDSRTGVYPNVPSDLLTCVTEMFVDINPRWLLTGKKSMVEAPEELISVQEPKSFYGICDICLEKNKTIEALQKRSERDEMEIDRLWNQINCKGDDKSKRDSA